MNRERTREARQMTKMLSLVDDLAACGVEPRVDPTKDLDEIIDDLTTRRAIAHSVIAAIETCGSAYFFGVCPKDGQ